ncbi:MAG TPA: helix-turn-helix transcriptional regulator [Caulifigura sp.]|jgi:DNA-binding transcriptional ArsR family regulator|nr:helix-turn-helix transcriptional regulator [Caulifigura sp.]
MTPDSMDALFAALAHRDRRKMLDLIQTMPGCSVQDVAKYFDCSRIMVMKHLDVLSQAELVISRKVGRRRELFFNAVPIQRIYDRWTTEYSRFWATKALDLKLAIESRNQKDPP